MRHLRIKALSAAAIICTCPVAAFAQDSDFDRLMAMDSGSLEGEIQTRYDAGLATSLDSAIQAANDPRYLWALEAKVQCGIALGYLKSSTRDETSIRNCDRAYHRMTYVAPRAPAPVPPPPPPPQRPAICNDEIAGIVFFEFDSAELTADAGRTLDTVVTNIRTCGWRTFQIAGHTDQAGSDSYNVGLSQQRAAAVQAALASRGVAAGSMTITALGESRPRVVLADGTRSPENRRVEISAD
jgi:OOP family OmpA-OmpF porin